MSAQSNGCLELLIPVEDIARICHEANRAYCITIGDDSQVSWEDAAEWQRESAIEGVKFVMSNPVTGQTDPARMQHDNWMEDKLKDGWRYGVVKDADAKTHPCLLPYDSLPDNQKWKDWLFYSIAETFIVR